MKKTISIVLVLAFTIGLIPGVAKAKLVACVGDSITYGWGISNRNDNSYPAQLAGILPMLQGFDSDWETQNFGHSGATLLRSKGASYVTKTAYSRALESEPDVVIIQLGSNDSARASSSEIEQRFISDYLELIDAFAQLPSQPRIFVCNPPPVFGGGYGSNTMIRDVIIPLIQQLPTYRAVEAIDLYTLFEDSGHLFPDYLHPNAEGAGMIAEMVASAILSSTSTPDFNGDEIVDIGDLVMLIDHWGQDERSVDIGPPPFGDGIVDVQDLEVLMSYWQQEVLPVELVAYWKLDETEGMLVVDSAGDNNGYALGDPIWQPDGGQVDGALELDGVDDFISAPTPLNPAYGPFSVLAWVKGGAPGQAIMSEQSRLDWLSLDPLNGYLMTEIAGDSHSGGPLFSQTGVDDGNWHRIGFVWDGSCRTLYVDGVAVAQDVQDGLKSLSGSLYIGCAKNMQPGTFFSGLIDDIRIYYRVITP